MQSVVVVGFWVTEAYCSVLRSYPTARELFSYGETIPWAKVKDRESPLHRIDGDLPVTKIRRCGFEEVHNGDLG